MIKCVSWKVLLRKSTEFILTFKAARKALYISVNRNCLPRSMKASGSLKESVARSVVGIGKRTDASIPQAAAPRSPD